MKRFPFAYTIGTAALAAMFGGCSSNAQPPIAPWNQGAALLEQRLHPMTSPHQVLDQLVPRIAMGRSWMSPRAKTRELVYVADSGVGTVNVYAGKGWVEAGELLGFKTPYTFCIDAAQNVYVTDVGNATITEYAHGTVAPIRVISDHQGGPIGCAIDPNTGDLAVTNIYGAGAIPPGNVIIYKGAKGTPTVYTAPNLYSYFLIAYDDRSNLFVNGENSGESAAEFAKLPKGKKAFRPLALNQTIGFAGGIAWDGEFLVVGDQLTDAVYRFTISESQGAVKGTTTLVGSSSGFQFSFEGSSAKHPQATALVLANVGANAVSAYEYPAGGTALKTISSLTVPNGALGTP